MYDGASPWIEQWSVFRHLNLCWETIFESDKEKKTQYKFVHYNVQFKYNHQWHGSTSNEYELQWLLQYESITTYQKLFFCFLGSLMWSVVMWRSIYCFLKMSIILLSLQVTIFGFAETAAKATLHIFYYWSCRVLICGTWPKETLFHWWIPKGSAWKLFWWTWTPAFNSRV